MPVARPIVESDVEYFLSSNCSGVPPRWVCFSNPLPLPPFCVFRCCLIVCHHSILPARAPFLSAHAPFHPVSAPLGIGPPISRASIILSSTFSSPTLEWLPSVAMVEFEATERSDGGGLNCRVHRMANVCSKRLAEDWANVEGTAAR